MGYTSLCTELLQGLPAINTAPVQDGDPQHRPASCIHAPKRSLIWLYFAFFFLKVCFVLSGGLGMSRAGLAMPVLGWGLQQELRELAQGPVRGSRRGAGASSEGS